MSRRRSGKKTGFCLNIRIFCRATLKYVFIVFYYGFEPFWFIYLCIYLDIVPISYVGLRSYSQKEKKAL